jgi:hypothetical protein
MVSGLIQEMRDDDILRMRGHEAAPALRIRLHSGGNVPRHGSGTAWNLPLEGTWGSGLKEGPESFFVKEECDVGIASHSGATCWRCDCLCR